MAENKELLYVDIDEALRKAFNDDLTSEERNSILKILKQSISIHITKPNNKYYTQPKEALEYLTKDDTSAPKAWYWLVLPTIQNILSSFIIKLLGLLVVIAGAYVFGIVDMLTT